MSPASLFDVLLAIALVAVATVAVLVPRRQAAVAVFLVFGVLLALLWARLDAPDIALAEAALGGGIAGALLVDALSSPPPAGRPPRAGPARIVTSVLAGLAALGALAVVVRRIPLAAGPLPEAVEANLEVSGATHPVTAVLLNFRSYDTLLEVAVLAVTAIGVRALATDGGATPTGAPVALRGLAHVLIPVVVLLSAWFLVAGTSRPGGAFQAGAMLGAGLVVAHLAGSGASTPRPALARLGIVAGTLAFVALALGTAALGGGWLVLGSWAGAAILALETVLAISIGVGLAAVFAAARAPAPREAR